MWLRGNPDVKLISVNKRGPMWKHERLIAVLTVENISTECIQIFSLLICWDTVMILVKFNRELQLG